jgi:hypothetical protein
MGVQLLPVGPGVPPALAAVLQSFSDAILALQSPAAPANLPVIDTASNLLLKAPAAKFPNCAIVVTDKNTVAISTSVAGTWTWLRADGSAL